MDASEPMTRSAAHPEPPTSPATLAHPFIYVASLRRTGSTVLAEALTRPPDSFIFREPHFGRNRFALKDDDATLFAGLGIDIAAMRERWLEDRRERSVLDALKAEFLPAFAQHFRQVGVKEIRHEGWREYAAAFPGMKAVLSGRDPRDIYISLYHRQREGMGSWKGEYTPHTVAADLLEQFAFQREMDAETDCIRVRYEDLCADPAAAFESIRNHVRSPLQSIGEIGGFLGRARGRRIEADLHGGAVTDQRVARWRGETDDRLVGDARRCFDLMADYAAFWGYAE
jgi:hypothetical protein